MIRKIEKADYPRMIEIWTSAVEHTHDFLKREDFEYYQEQLPSYFEQVNLWGYVQEGLLVGFIGVAEESLEMLFIHNDYRGKGIGKILTRYGMDNLKVSKVDVNEQNVQAVGFYTHLGFGATGRSEYDGQGKAYPILHMSL
ncbi:GNAT family N-acetyltransferase [Sphingobacterium yanglingense]|uniref:Putative acetyltransferase n=1 Tax=Sphingobacterium yanglingense TaxID=1437280 RepID=A0A4R6WGN5_9SPHI|nr:GNAT family N-acetyltransferase [Sphingobacterium yanglingense]TDQ77347.1 putative acetyltransferase [Sphingobacterium yanglingense]